MSTITYSIDSEEQDDEKDIEIDDLLDSSSPKCPLGYRECIGVDCPYFHKVKKRCTYFDECSGPC